MSLPGHRRTSSHKRRRASHFALVKPTLTTDKDGKIHRPHRAGPGATEYNGNKIFIKGLDRKMAKLVKKTKSATVTAEEKEHEGHDHKGHSHGPAVKAHKK